MVMISAPAALADPLLAGVGVAASAVTGCSRGRARSAPSAPAGFCAGGIANCAEAFGSASPLQLAKIEEFYVGALLILFILYLNYAGPTDEAKTRQVAGRPSARLYFPAFLRLLWPSLLALLCTREAFERKWGSKRVLGIGGVSLSRPAC